MLRSSNIQSYSFNRPFDGSHNVEVALSENEFDTPDLVHLFLFTSGGDLQELLFRDL